ncbi:DUF6397 family protein [Streptomyces sp. LP11]|uniref:DUF6397 family protein n=1 Tax=Streptomyces pyxinicus TaxID=2970331 RepID=A0ABT2AXB5_9ACTN|nr:DUF6397 family protein [Streptomyces sp. LP11]MCS0600894.1 DUF6397 family protein [Streptomyces sp. LP11]
MSTQAFGPSGPATCTMSHAARELGLKRAELDLAVQLGRIRTVPDEGGGGARRVEHPEIDRLRAQDGFPGTLLERVRAVGTAEGAALMEIPAGRFTRLARLGLLLPVRFYSNRYRAVVWLYLAEELRQFKTAPENTRLLKGRTPETLRAQLEAGVDLRARNWRGRHLGFLLRQAEEPWARAGALAAFLPAIEVAEVVKDPYERAHINGLRPAPPGQAAPGSASAHLAERLMTAQDTDEIAWLRAELDQVLDEARTLVPAPRPAPRKAPALRAAARPIPPMAPTVTRPATPVHRPALPAPQRRDDPGPRQSRPARGPRAWLRRRNPRPVQA